MLAAGEGRRLRPLSERWPKAIQPIDGRPVVATLVRDLGAAGCKRITVVTGHLAEQVEALLGDGAAFGVDVSYVRQPRPDGSADAVRRAFAGGADTPALVAAADTVYGRGTFERFLSEWSSAPGAVAARLGQPRSGGKPGVDPRLARALPDPDALTNVPLWGFGSELVPFLDDLPGPPYELADGVDRALDAGLDIRGVVVPATRDLTDPLDVVRENFTFLDA